MESPPICLPYAAAAHDSIGTEEEKGKENHVSQAEVVDQFLMEVIENPRHRLTGSSRNYTLFSLFLDTHTHKQKFLEI